MTAADAIQIAETSGRWEDWKEAMLLCPPDSSERERCRLAYEAKKGLADDE